MGTNICIKYTYFEISPVFIGDFSNSIIVYDYYYYYYSKKIELL
jgi:hypothetical protein